jgi:hypothetical protein
VCDIRRYPEKHPNLTVLTADILREDFRGARFDIAILISTVEHIGFGSYGDPLREDGDLIAMRKVRQILKHGGRAIITTPFSGQQCILPHFERWYDEQRLSSLLDGFRLVLSEFWIPALWVKGRCLKWTRSTTIEAKQCGNPGGYHATACLVAERGDACTNRIGIPAARP